MNFVILDEFRREENECRWAESRGKGWEGKETRVEEKGKEGREGGRRGEKPPARKRPLFE